MNACQCRNFSNATTGETTGCTKHTVRTFAPGHDAKLKSLLIRTGAAGHGVLVEGMDEEQDPCAVADSFGFGHLVAAGVKKAQDKAFAKALKESVTEEPKPEPEATHTVMAKVGRWVYEGVLFDNGHGFTYVNKKDETVSTRKFTVQ